MLARARHRRAVKKYATVADNQSTDFGVGTPVQPIDG
jgi:hypothetical protein